MNGSDPGIPAQATRLPDGREALILGRFALRTEAYERGLVVAAMEIPHWILREDGAFLLCVRPQHLEKAAREISAWEAERSLEKKDGPDFSYTEKTPKFSLWVAGWIGATFFLIQDRAPELWTTIGASDSRAVLRGEWWRVFTALTLHADASHIGANLAAMLIFAGFGLAFFGGGWTWLGVVASGALGNWLNAWGHRGEGHISIGSSTAVFGALGMLVGAQIVSQILTLRRIRLREILMPLGAGLAWLAWFGVGGRETDFTAHFCGLFAGVLLGAAGVFFPVRKWTPRAVQIVLGVAALGVLVFAWTAAVANASEEAATLRQSLSPHKFPW